MSDNVIAPDCDTCYKQSICQEAVSMTFCPMWQSKEPKPEGINPRDAWSMGLDDE